MNQEKDFNHININWYPGHMTKAKREMSEKIKLVDMVIEIRDARIPLSSINPLLDEIIGSKPRLIVLSKADKAENEETKKWIDYFKLQGHETIALNLIGDKNVANTISDCCLTIMKDKIEKLKTRGLKRVEIRAMVVGIPNVGKSTLINSVGKRKMAKTADKPGVTRSLTWIKVSNEVALLDTPGVLWPKFEDLKVGFMLAITGAIRDDVLPMQSIIEFALDFLIKNHREKLIKRYDIEVSEDIFETINKIAISRGCIQQDETIDYKRVYALILKDIRDNQLGLISWEKTDEDYK
ncbi:MAG TPA: ribosome biogenesis GTPase YlqF [Erysipelotrichaceae bacterium]|jgi:ribosome biogenesis GTPase A|nr:ribosome biogenesis GTPase YlqF [Erysipelotrichaceae bacterium]HQA85649.1 ribosome biogenesis GTPase YlqF [Erysipelotrichaceae bacterium]